MMKEGDGRMWRIGWGREVRGRGIKRKKKDEDEGEVIGGG